MEIQTVAVVGLGALGTLFGHRLSTHMPCEQLRVVADAGRIGRYEREGVYSNGERCDFRYVAPEAKTGPADLVLIAVKYLQLQSALQSIRHQVGEHTLILSLLNGITSEGIIAAAYGADKVIDCVAYGMDAVKEGNRLTYRNMGKLCIGPRNGDPVPEPVERIRRFFQQRDFPYEIDRHMEKRLWGKFMLNVGVNQTVAVFGPNYAAIQHEGEQRQTMVAAMREVVALSQLEGVNLTETDLAYWLNVLSTLNPEGKPSMRQDVEAERPSEVALFAGAVLELAKKHGLDTPVNRMLMDALTGIEAGYGQRG
ncbi:MAG: ketopantoate reductase family protein [Clostridiales bacterium]|nr:ketopantoate reductase family protein [Clostridiales bacterium]